MLYVVLAVPSNFRESVGAVNTRGWAVTVVSKNVLVVPVSFIVQSTLVMLVLHSPCTVKTSLGLKLVIEFIEKEPTSYLKTESKV